MFLRKEEEFSYVEFDLIVKKDKSHWEIAPWCWETFPVLQISYSFLTFVQTIIKYRF